MSTICCPRGDLSQAPVPRWILKYTFCIDARTLHARALLLQIHSAGLYVVVIVPGCIEPFSPRAWSIIRLHVYDAHRAINFEAYCYCSLWTSVACFCLIVFFFSSYFSVQAKHNIFQCSVCPGTNCRRFNFGFYNILKSSDLFANIWFNLLLYIYVKKKISMV